MKANRIASGLLTAFALMAFSPAIAAEPSGGPKKTIAVGGFEASETAGGATTADGLSAMLTAALLKDGRFVVLERAGMAQIQWEQQLGQTGNAAAGTAPQAGQLIAANVLVRGTVTKFDAHSSGGGLNVGGPGLFGGVPGVLGVNGQTAVVEIALRLIDTTTGQVIDSASARGTASATGLSGGVYTHGVMIGGSGFSETPLGKACQDAIGHAVERIDLGMEHVPWSALVVDDDGSRIFLNAGTDRNMQVGMKLHVIRKVRDLTDPATGVVLETITQQLGDIEVRDVHDKVSIAVLLSGAPPARGDIVRLN